MLATQNKMDVFFLLTVELMCLCKSFSWMKAPALYSQSRYLFTSIFSNKKTHFYSNEQTNTVHLRTENLNRKQQKLFLWKNTFLQFDWMASLHRCVRCVFVVFVYFHVERRTLLTMWSANFLNERRTEIFSYIYGRIFCFAVVSLVWSPSKRRIRRNVMINIELND